MTTLLNHTERKAAHEHVCRLCHRKIAQGETYADQRLAGEGTAWTWRAHSACHSAYWSWNIDPEDHYDLSDWTGGHLPPCGLAWARRGPYVPPCECNPGLAA